MGFFSSVSDNDEVVLLNNVSVAGSGPAKIVTGGDYLVSILGTVGTSVQLEYLGKDGNWYPSGAARTTNDSGNTPKGPYGTGIGNGTQIRATVTGTPSNLYVTLNKLGL